MLGPVHLCLGGVLQRPGAGSPGAGSWGTRQGCPPLRSVLQDPCSRGGERLSRETERALLSVPPRKALGWKEAPQPIKQGILNLLLRWTLKTTVGVMLGDRAAAVLKEAQSSGGLKKAAGAFSKARRFVLLSEGRGARLKAWARPSFVVPSSRLAAPDGGEGVVWGSQGLEGYLGHFSLLEKSNPPRSYRPLKSSARRNPGM